MAQHPYEPGVSTVPRGAPPVGKDFQTHPDHVHTAGDTMLLSGATHYRRTLLIANLASSPGEIRLGGTPGSTGAAAGLPVGAGQVATIVTAGEVYVYAAVAAVVSVTEVIE